MKRGPKVAQPTDSWVKTKNIGTKEKLIKSDSLQLETDVSTRGVVILFLLKVARYCVHPHVALHKNDPRGIHAATCLDVELAFMLNLYLEFSEKSVLYLEAESWLGSNIFWERTLTREQLSACFWHFCWWSDPILAVLIAQCSLCAEVNGLKHADLFVVWSFLEYVLTALLVSRCVVIYWRYARLSTSVWRCSAVGNGSQWCPQA